MRLIFFAGGIAALILPLGLSPLRAQAQEAAAEQVTYVAAEAPSEPPSRLIRAKANPRLSLDPVDALFARSTPINPKQPVGAPLPVDPLAYGPFLPPAEPPPIVPDLLTPAAAQAQAARTTGQTAMSGSATLQRSQTSLVVTVSLASQQMQVYRRGELLFDWPVSTARVGKETPRGTFAVEWLSKNHQSSLYNGAAMPFAIFYDGDYAIHGTESEHRLGAPASSGCVRLSRGNAEQLFAMVRREGQHNLLIEITD